jgi:hypothetical protein
MPCAAMAAHRRGSRGARLSDRLRAREAHLDAVVLRGVVRRGEHRAGSVELAGGEVEEVGGREADVDHIDALQPGTLRERGRELDARRAHVASQHDARGAVVGDGKRNAAPMAAIWASIWSGRCPARRRS